MGFSPDMHKRKEVLDHALHNEEVCDSLNIHKKYTDWIITTAFYASLHFVSYKVFPFKHPIQGHPDKIINTIEEWQSHKSFTSNKRHDLLSQLVSKYCLDVSEKYDWLLSLAKTSRYHQYYFDVQISDQAVRYMKDISKSCQQTI